MTQRLTDKGAHDDPRDAALRWTARKLSGAMNADERRSFEEWFEASPANRAAFSETERLLSAVDAAGDDLLAEEFERQMADEAAKTSASRRIVLTRIAAGVALAGAVALGAVVATTHAPTTVAQFDTLVGERERVALADGSQIELNTASRLTVSYDSKSRSVDLAAGEAFFSVEQDRQRPFVVSTAAATVTVTGTAFSVSNYDGGATIRVLSGVVDVAPKSGQQSTLLAGDMIEIGANGAAGAIRRFDAGLDLAWRSGKLRFRDAPLEEVLTALNRHFEAPIELGEADLAEIPVTGEFDVSDRETVVQSLAIALGLTSRDEPARTILGEAE